MPPGSTLWLRSLVVPPLATRTWGDGPLLVLLHGFTQTSSCWGPFGTLLGHTRTIMAVDLPGHGASAACSADLDETAQLVLESVGSDNFDLLGYSLGGRVALTTALAAPARVRHLVLLGATAGIEDDTAASERRASDERLAASIEDEDDVPAFLRRWLAQDLFADLKDNESQFEERCANTPAGLADSLRRSGAGTQRSSWSSLGALHVPTLVVAGVDDVKFSAIGRRMVSLLPDGHLALIPGGSHACHLTQPDIVSHLVDTWLD